MAVQEAGELLLAERVALSAKGREVERGIAWATPCPDGAGR
ncbi:hypothetical protein ACFUJR_32085 [Streptomyces sp. NPDC057271]